MYCSFLLAYDSFKDSIVVVVAALSESLFDYSSLLFKISYGGTRFAMRNLFY